MTAQKFISLFRDEYEQYCLLKKKVKSKKMVIMENDIEGLAEIVEDEQKILRKIEELESKRHTFLNQIAGEKNLDESQISFKKLLDLMPEEKEGMMALKGKFLNVLEEIQTINEANRHLIEDSLQITNTSLQLIKDAVDRKKRYKSSSEDDDGLPEHRVDRRV